jgi:UDP-N-acetylmuramoyl-L-alanyl-D-glutamate--2,6-diaminopimelate ligase
LTLTDLCAQSGIHGHYLVGDAKVSRLVMDSRKILPGDLFVAMPSEVTDSHQYILGAIECGAVGAIVHNEQGLKFCEGHVGLYLKDYENELWKLCKTITGNPSSEMKIVGITGTNGKTTTAWILRDMLTALGVPSAYMGTLGFQYPGYSVELPNTTPFVVDTYNYLVEARDAGIKAVAMEVSSHALAQKRVEGLEFDVAVMTNLTQDHLDFHGSLAAYAEAKWRLFSNFGPVFGCFNIDDQTVSGWNQKFNGEKIGYTAQGRPGAELVGVPTKVAIDGIDLKLTFNGETRTAESHLAGSYNVSNLVSACSALLGLGYSLDEVAAAIPSATPVPGRFESVKGKKPVGVIVDYAHTPDALDKLLRAVRPLTAGKVITVFGCGGDRDNTKRSIMAKVASEKSDLTVITSDNPRTEEPRKILEQVAAGIKKGKESVLIEDRIEAIYFAINSAKEGDTVVIAGKGHENYQIVGREKFHLDDREIAREVLNAP